MPSHLVSLACLTEISKLGRWESATFSAMYMFGLKHRLQALDTHNTKVVFSTTGDIT